MSDGSGIRAPRLPNALLAVLLFSAALFGQVPTEDTSGFPYAEKRDSPAAPTARDNSVGYDNTIPGGFTNGSELDQFFLTANSARSTLYVGLTGNLEPNGNVILILLDTVAGGQNVLTGVGQLPGALAGLRDDTLEVGFDVDYVLQVSVADGLASLDWYDLTGPPRHISRGHGQLNTRNNTLSNGTDGGILLAFDDTNTVGVTGASAGRAATATTGVEIAIPLALLGIQGLPATVRAQALLTGKTGYLSNQSLPSFPAGTRDRGAGSVNFVTIPDAQMAEVVLADQPWTGVIDGQSIPTDFANGPVAIQMLPTSFGDQQPAAINNRPDPGRLMARNTNARGTGPTDANGQGDQQRQAIPGDGDLSRFVTAITSDPAPPAAASGPLGTGDSIFIVILRLTWAALIGWVIGYVYRRTFTGKKFKPTLPDTHVLLAVAGCLIWMVIGNSLAKAFGLGAAVGLIRYRTIVQDPKDTTLLLFSMILGMACGLTQYSIAIAGTLMTVVVLIWLQYSDRKKRQNEAAKSQHILDLLSDDEAVQTEKG